MTPPPARPVPEARRLAQARGAERPKDYPFTLPFLADPEGSTTEELAKRRLERA